MNSYVYGINISEGYLKSDCPNTLKLPLFNKMHALTFAYYKNSDLSTSYKHYLLGYLVYWLLHYKNCNIYQQASPAQVKLTVFSYSSLNFYLDYSSTLWKTKQTVLLITYSNLLGKIWTLKIKHV